MVHAMALNVNILVLYNRIRLAILNVNLIGINHVLIINTKH